MTITILLADDHPLIREGLRRVLAAETGLAVVAEAEDGLEALRLAERVRPDVLVLDLMLPGLSGLEVLPILRQRSPRTQIVILSMQAGEAFVLAAVKNGALAYVLKTTPTPLLIEAIREAAAGRRYFSPPLSVDANERYLEKSRETHLDPHETLTPRERQVLQLGAEGRSSSEIAERLRISPRTVEHHRARMMHKLSLQNQSDLVRYAIRRGLISADS